MNKKDLSEADICAKYITPSVKDAGWDEMTQIRREVSFTNRRIIVRGKLVSRGKSKRTDYILYYKPNVPIAIIEAKDNKYSVGDGMQQGLDYSKILDIPFVFSSNGDGYVFHDRTGQSAPMEQNLAHDACPTPEQLWEKYPKWKGLAPTDDAIVRQDYFEDGSGKEPRYYQSLAINRTIEAIAKGHKLQNMLIPLPPLAEQKRIVAKVGELMVICDALEAQLTTSQSESQQLLEACLNEAIA